MHVLVRIIAVDLLDDDDDGVGDHNADDCNLGVIFGTSNDTLREIAQARTHEHRRVRFVYGGSLLFIS